MPNYYVGTGSNEPQGQNATLRSGYEKVIENDQLNLNAQMGHVSVNDQTANATGNGWGAFTLCGGLIAKTEDTVYLVHASDNNYLNNQWNNDGTWLHDNKDAIVKAVLINFAYNAPGNHGIMQTIANYFTAKPTVILKRVIRHNNKAMKASANMNGVFLMNGVNYNNPFLNLNWENFTNENINQPG